MITIEPLIGQRQARKGREFILEKVDSRVDSILDDGVRIGYCKRLPGWPCCFIRHDLSEATEAAALRALDERDREIAGGECINDLLTARKVSRPVPVPPELLEMD